MKPNPSTYVRLAMRAARRRRYGYAALRVLRRGLRTALAEHFARSVDVGRPYASELEAIQTLFRRGVAELVRRFGLKILDDERAAP